MQIKNNDKGITQSVVIPFGLREQLLEAIRSSGQSISSFVCEAIQKKLGEAKSEGGNEQRGRK